MLGHNGPWDTAMGQTRPCPSDLLREQRNGVRDMTVGYDIRPTDSEVVQEKITERVWGREVGNVDSTGLPRR